MKRLVLLSFLYSLCVLLFSGLIAFFYHRVPSLLLGSVRMYRLADTFLLFFKILPSVLLATYLVSYSVMFKTERHVLIRFSPVLFVFFKKVILAALGGTIIVFLVAEIAVPAVTRYMDEQKQAPALYAQYIASAQKYLEEESYSVAYQYAVAAEEIYPGSTDAIYLKETAEVHFGPQPQGLSADSSAASIPVPEDADIIFSDNASSYELLQRAQVLYQQENWIDAHYYSCLAQVAAVPGSANETDAKILAADAWNQLENIRYFSNPEAESLFYRKKTAYQHLMSGDIFSAYYAFRELADEYPSDPDVVRYFSIAAHEMEQQYFFFDEIPGSEIIEDFSNTCFRVSRADGKYYVVYIRGAAAVHNTGRMIQYLRDVTVYQYSRIGTFEQSLYVPYAKVLAQPVSSLDSQTRNELGVTGRNAAVPVLMLESADRMNPEPASRPEYVFSEESAVAGEISNVLLLPMPFSDFVLLQDVSYNPDDMTLFDLLMFAGKASEYGYAAEVYTQALCSRICYPLIYISLFIFMAIIGWNYRLLPGVSFRLSWVLILPVLTVVMYGLIQIFRYIGQLLNYGIIEIFGVATVPVIIVCSVLLMVIVSILFVSRKS